MSVGAYLSFSVATLPVFAMQMLYGYMAPHLGGWGSPVKFFFAGLLYATFIIRLKQIYLELRPNSLFYTTVYSTELIAFVYHSLMMFRCQKVDEFVKACEFKSFARVTMYQRRMTLVTLMNVTLTVITSYCIMTYWATQALVDSPQYMYYFIFHFNLIDSWVLPSCSVYSLALIFHWIKCDSRLVRFHTNLLVRRSTASSDLLDLIQTLQSLHLVFEDIFSFMPFLWICYNWSQATVYIIGATLGGLSEFYDPFVVAWSILSQVAAFATVYLSIFVSNSLGLRCQLVLCILEKRVNRVSSGSDTAVYLMTRLDGISSSKFTAGKCFALTETTIFHYLGSLISFSVLTLQVDPSKKSKG